MNAVSFIYLQPVKQDDLSLMMEWRNDPKISPWFFSAGPTSLEAQQKWFDNLYKKPREKIWIIRRYGDKKRVGTVGLRHIDLTKGEAEFGRFLVCSEEQGKGYGSAAAEALVRYALGAMGLKRLYCNVLEDNEAAFAVYARVGFNEEYCRQGISRMSILKEEVRCQVPPESLS